MLPRLVNVLTTTGLTDIKHDIEAIRRRVETIDADINIYTDGSCTGGVSDVGAAAVVTTGPFDEPVCIDVIEAKGDRRTSSYEEERRALCIDGLTDSLSLLQAMENDHPDTADICSRQIRACDRVDLLYVPGHKDISGNEPADVHAKAAAALDQPYAIDAISFRTDRSIIKIENGANQIRLTM